ncbi:Wings apart-like protein regulation of heterochromatin [Teratosphaeria destructans]|uniref:Wings apart-like protein regulation of heterochromatin n=1 Tax=Teratosphaeria destructans TaxID=418781 RepID=A0A9W7VZY1_9PEZI|nr:Wings apart-like protein regulation of heterochromatin [Teratosphaeria destructans]
MTTLYPSRLDRPKKVVRYGKSSSRSSYNTKHVDSWIEDDALVSNPAKAEGPAESNEPSPKLASNRPSPKVESGTFANKMESGTFANKVESKGLLKRVKMPERDAWDVPSDDEVREEFELRRPRLKNRKLVMLHEEALAPWEREGEDKAETKSATRPEQSKSRAISPPINKRQPTLAARRKHSARSPATPSKRAGMREERKSPSNPTDTASAKDQILDFPAKPSTHPRRSRLASRPSTIKGSSAPARLSDMLPMDTDSTDPSLSPVMASPSTPRGTTPSHSGSKMTPKQTELWSQLLPDPPSQLGIQDLSLAGRPRLNLARSMSDIPHRRTRLVDRLKAAAESSDDSDVEMEEAAIPDEPVSQPPPQGAVTYARARSYLQEDSLDDVLFGMQTFSRQPNGSNSDSDEHSHGGLRTIHELRAAGRNDRFTQDTTALLEDIADHVVSARARRRSALLELALKMSDKAYVERFVSQGFEHHLIAELSAPEDLIADSALAAVVAMLIASEHVVRAIADAGTIAWAAKLLNLKTPLTKMSKDRKFNMSKASQSDLAKSVEKMRMSTVLWETTPSILSPRMIALRLTDLLSRALRKSGDHSDIVNEDILHRILDQSEDGERGLIISVLESLSTSAHSLDWPVVVVEEVAAAVQQAITADRHTTFLSFRLTLNLTNNNPRNCTYFSSDKLVGSLIVTIKDGFNDTTTEHRAINMDLLVLAMGIMINLAEHCPAARLHAISATAQAAMTSLLDIFTAAQEGLEEAESLDASQTNVAFGYLAVMLANLCMDDEVRGLISSKLPGKNLILLVSAVEEFVTHHQRVDALGLGMDGVDGREVWGAFTEKLKCVLMRLKIMAGMT